ncbi:MAG: hypothetical protein ACJA01_000300 [Saprospiraceae bacterium]|jgi:hypothetical protein
MVHITLPEKKLQDHVKDYYRGERVSNALLFLLGGAAITWTLLLYLWRHGQLSSGIFYSAIPLAGFLIITGGYRFIRSLSRYNNAQDTVSGNAFLLNEELPHLEGRKIRFAEKRKVNTIGFLTGFILIGLGISLGWNHIFLGTAISLTIFSSLLLVFDLFGQFRTDEFLHHLKKWKKKR